MKYQCPYCNAELTEDDVMRGMCPHCKKILDFSELKQKDLEEESSQPQYYYEKTGLKDRIKSIPLTLRVLLSLWVITFILSFIQSAFAVLNFLFLISIGIYILLKWREEFGEIVKKIAGVLTGALTKSEDKVSDFSSSLVKIGSLLMKIGVSLIFLGIVLIPLIVIIGGLTSSSPSVSNLPSNVPVSSSISEKGDRVSLPELDKAILKARLEEIDKINRQYNRQYNVELIKDVLYARLNDNSIVWQVEFAPEFDKVSIENYKEVAKAFCEAIVKNYSENNYKNQKVKVNVGVIVNRFGDVELKAKAEYDPFLGTIIVKEYTYTNTGKEFIDPLLLEKGKFYRVSERTLVVPEFLSLYPSGTITKGEYIEAGGVFKVISIGFEEHDIKKTYPWYYVGFKDASTGEVVYGWINSAALAGQTLEEVK